MNETDNGETDDSNKVLQAPDDNGDTVRLQPKREVAQRALMQIRQQINYTTFFVGIVVDAPRSYICHYMELRLH